MLMLADSDKYYDRIKHIIFIGPPFWGALSPIQVVEYGYGIETDGLLPTQELRKAAATMTGVFNMLPAPPEYWPQSFPGLSQVHCYILSDRVRIFIIPMLGPIPSIVNFERPCFALHFRIIGCFQILLIA